MVGLLYVVTTFRFGCSLCDRSQDNDLTKIHKIWNDLTSQHCLQDYELVQFNHAVRNDDVYVLLASLLPTE